MNGLEEVLQRAGLSQAKASSRASVQKSVVSEVVNRKKGLSVAAAIKSAPVLGVDAGVLYGSTQLVAIVRAVEEAEVDEATAADRLLNVVRKILVNFDGLEDEEGGEELVQAIEDALEEFTSGAVEQVKGEKGEKAATKARENASFDSLDQEGRNYFGVRVAPLRPVTAQKSADDDYGERRDSRRLRDPEEGRFADVDSFGLSNEPNTFDDDVDDDGIDGDGRDINGKRIVPFGELR